MFTALQDYKLAQKEVKKRIFQEARVYPAKLKYCNVKSTPLSTFNRYAPLSDNPSSVMAASPMVLKVCSDKSFIMDLPAEIVADILSRLPIKIIARCNCVCKNWRSILSKPDFVNLHLSISPASTIICKDRQRREDNSMIFKLVELEDKPELVIHRDPLMRFDLGRRTKHGQMALCGSVNGLICLWQYPNATCICNPITREYILLPYHKYIRKSFLIPTYGFGFVKVSNEYKVICFYQNDIPSTEGSDKLGCEVYTWCEVYTLGTGMWRSLGQVPFLVDADDKAAPYISDYIFWYRNGGIFVGGNLHWLVYDQKDTNHEKVCTFDLKKEVFQLTASPQVSEDVVFRTLGMLEGCLCVCDTTLDPKTAIWVLKDYGMKESWSKEIVIQDNYYSDLLYGMVHPLKVLKDGTILLSSSFIKYLRSYDTGNKTFQELDIYARGDPETPNAMIFVPSFIRLKSFTLEKVSVF